MSFLAKKYYDAPEGEDCLGKMVATNKYALCTGLAWSTVEVLCVSKPKGYLPTLGRFGYYVGPFMGMATAFTLSTYVAANLRKKDDRINYLIGGFAAGGVYGAWQRSVVSGLVVGLFFAVAGSIKKLSKIEGWEFLPDINDRVQGSLNGVTHDFTLMKDPLKK